MIEAGEQYRRYRYWCDGDAGTVKLHAECFEAMQDEAAYEGGWIEWTPGSGERHDRVQAGGASPATTGSAQKGL